MVKTGKSEKVQIFSLTLYGSDSEGHQGQKLDFTSLYSKQHKVVPFLITRLLDYHFQEQMFIKYYFKRVSLLWLYGFVKLTSLFWVIGPLYRFCNPSSQEAGGVRRGPWLLIHSPRYWNVC